MIYHIERSVVRLFSILNFLLRQDQVKGSFVFLTEDTRNKNPLKILESVGKELITGVLDDLVGKNVLKLEEEEKKKIYDAKLEDKARVLVDSMRQKRHEAGQIFVQTFLNIEKNSTSIKGKTGIVFKGYLKFFRSTWLQGCSTVL